MPPPRDTTKVTLPGRVVETAGRRIVVRDETGDRFCFLGGHRAVVGDVVRWTEAPGEGGKIVTVEDRRSALFRLDPRGEEQLLAANLGGLIVCAAPKDPPFLASLIDRYVVAAATAGIEAAIVLTKSDLEAPPEVEEDLAIRAALGIPVLRTSIRTGAGLDELRAFLAEHNVGPWALVGHSGTGKTSLIGAILPDFDVGPIGAISDYWGTGRHTTTRTCLFSLPQGGEIVDSPGIRGFIPALLDPIRIRDTFPGIAQIQCQYRDCLHRPDEEGCEAGGQVAASLLESYRRLVQDALDITRRRGPAPSRPRSGGGPGGHRGR